MAMAFFSGSEEEMKAALERQQMEAEVNTLALQSLIRKADKEELQALANTFLRIGVGDQTQGVWYAGIMAGIIHERHGDCFGCEKNHSVKTEDFGPPVPDDEQLVLDFDTAEPPGWAAYMKNCAEWGVEPQTLSIEGEVRCKGRNCDKIFPSLADRMLRKDCPACTQRAKWG